MAQTLSVLNVSRGYRLRFNQARRAVDQCAAEWVEVGVSIRDLTLQESVAARAQQAKDREPLPFAEVPGLSFEPATGQAGAHRQSRRLAYEAAIFVENPSAYGIPA